MNTIHTPDQINQITQTCLLAGQILLQNGGETYRVEDTMNRMATAFGISHSNSFVMPTGLFFTIEGSTHVTKLVRITNRSTNLIKVTMVNDISRKISNGELNAEEALDQLQAIHNTSYEYHNFTKSIAAAIVSSCFLIMFGGNWTDFIQVFFIGGMSFYFFLVAKRYISIIFLAEFLASIMIGALTILTVKMGISKDMDLMIIGAVMPLVPGIHITNAVRDLMAGQLVSGISKGAEAFLTAFAIGAGIAATLAFL